MLLTLIVVFGASAAQDTFGCLPPLKIVFVKHLPFHVSIAQHLPREALPHREKEHVPKMVSLLRPAYRCRNESSSQHHSFDCHSSN